MVSWIKNTASVTASICFVLAGPMVHPTLAQEAGNGSQAKSVIELAPEVRPVLDEPDVELQKAVAERAREIADNKILFTSIRSLPSVLSEKSLAASGTQENGNQSLPAVGEPGFEIGEHESAKTIRPSKTAAPTLATNSGSNIQGASTVTEASPQISTGDSTDSKGPVETDIAHVASSISERGPLPTKANLNLSAPAALPPIIQANELSAPDNSDAPTVIIRPPSDGSLVKDCHMEVKKIGDEAQGDYAVMLQVPDSVKVIEVLPSPTIDSNRNFRLRLDQPQGFENLVAETPKTPAMKISNGNQVISRQQDFNMPNLMKPVPQLRPLPPASVEQRTQSGFQKNPFFKSGSTRRKNKTTNLSAQPELLSSPSTMAATDSSSTQSVQVAYRSSGENMEPVATNVPYASEENLEQPPIGKSAKSVVVASSLRTEFTGPPEMKLGDTGDFTVVVSNQTDATATEVHVKLNVPSGMDVVVLDRQAWIDQSERTVTWRLPTIASGDEVIIRYRSLATAEGDIRQEISVDADGKVSGTAKIGTRVFRSEASNSNSQRPFEID